MRNSPPRAGTAESIISIFLLAVVFLIAAGIFVKQFRYNPDRFNLDPLAADGSVPKEPASSGTNLASLLPEGYKVKTEIENYESGNLYEKINGKAELYLSCGFEKLNCQRFAGESDENLWAELYIYDMGTAKNAFAVYSAQRRAEAIPLDGIRFGYKTSDAVFAAQDKYYIELIASTETPDLISAMVKVAKNFFKDVGTVDRPIAQLALFPDTNLVPHSFGLKISDTFGFEGLANTYTAQYRWGERIVMAFLSKQPDRKAAEDLTESYHKFLIDNGAVDKAAGYADFNIGNAKIVDFYGSIEIVFANGVFVAGVHQAEGQRPAEKTAVILNNKLSEVNKQ